MRNLSETCQECESLGKCPGRPPARDPTADGGETHGKLLAEAAIYNGPYNGATYCKVVQHIRWDDGVEAVRFGYYHIKADGRVIWGQFATMYNPGELERLLERARAKGILPF